MKQSESVTKVSQLFSALQNETEADGVFLIRAEDLVYASSAVPADQVTHTIKGLSTLTFLSNEIERMSPALEVNVDGSTALYARDGEITLGVFYKNKISNSLRLQTAVSEFLNKHYNAFSSVKLKAYHLLAELELRNTKQPSLVHKKEVKEESAAEDPSTPWRRFLPYLVALLCKVMNMDQAKFFISRMLKQKQIVSSPHEHEIAQISREIILTIPHKTKRNQLLSELHDVLIAAGVHKDEENVVTFKPR